MTDRSAATERHLEILDELAELGMVLARRVVGLPPAPGQDTMRDFELVARSVRRAILLSQLIQAGKLPSPAAPRPDAESASSRPPSDRNRGGAGTRLDSLDRLDSVGPTFEATVAAIVRDIQAVLRSCDLPLEPAIPVPPGATTPDRPEAGTPALE